MPAHHIRARSPLGEFTIEWKGWKESDPPVVYLNGNYVICVRDLPTAKDMAFSHLRDIILAALEPVAQPETPTPGQFTTMCLAIEDVVTGRGFDVAIPEAVKAYLRNALMVGGWRGERD